MVLCARYNVPPLNLQSHCDGCGTAFRVICTLNCNMGGLVIVGHNKLRDKLLYISQRDFISVSVRSELLIHQGITRSKQGIHQGSEKYKKTRGDMMVQCLWDRQVGAIIYIKLGDADADTYKYEKMIELLDMWGKINKDKHGKHCQAMA